MSVTLTDYMQMMTGLDLPVRSVNDVEIREIEVTRFDAESARIRAAAHGRRTAIREGSYVGLFRNGDLWMSNTPDEAYDLLDFIFRCEATSAERVLVNGLGLGMVVAALIEVPTVRHIDVVEIDPDVIALVGSWYEALGRHAGVTISYRCEDALTVQWPRGTRWDGAWHDIWQYISLSNLPEMSTLHRKYGRRVRFQDSWKRDELRELA